MYLFIGPLVWWLKCLPMARETNSGRVIPKIQKLVLDTPLLNTEHYKVCIKDKVEQSKERGSAFSYTLVLNLSKKDLSGRHRLHSPNLLYIYIYCHPQTDCFIVS